jgi:protein SCO1/2
MKEILLVGMMMLLVPAVSRADEVTPVSRANDLPPALQGVKLEVRLNKQVPLDAAFVDEDGKPVKVGDLMQTGRPVVLVLANYECKMLCTRALDGVARGLSDLAARRGLRVGKDLEVIVVSFDPREAPENAANKKDRLMKEYGEEGADPARWHYLTGKEQSIRHVTTDVGFRYRYDFVTRQYAHPSGIFVLTPGGRISRVFHGVEYDTNDLYYGLVEASEFKIGSPVKDRIVTLFCFSYDEERGKYQMRVINIVRI